MKILLAIPTAKYIESQTFKSVYDLIVPKGVEIDFQYFYGYRVDQVRNLICDWALKGGHDYIMFVDSDIGLPRDALRKMIEVDTDIVSGLYRARTDQLSYEIYDHDLRRIEYLPTTTIFPIGGCGFGCVLVKRRVIERISYPHFEYRVGDTATSINLSEDNDFCRKAADNGFEIWCDQSIRCDHYGTANYSMLPYSSGLLQAPSRLLQHYSKIRQENKIDRKGILASLERELDRAGKVPQVFYDLGSCVLHWTDVFHDVWPHAAIYAVDAVNQPDLEIMYERSDKLEDFVLGVALCSEERENIKFWTNSEHPAGSSLFKENPKYSPESENLYQAVHVKGRPLDLLARINSWEYPDVIKMDLQGGELDALRGATEVLKHAQYLIVEAQNVEYNIGAPGAVDVIAYLVDLGWTLRAIDRKTGAVDADYLFVKTG